MTNGTFRVKTAALQRRLVALQIGLLMAAVAGRAGTLTGTVRGQPPTPPREAGADGGAYDSRRYRYVEKIDYDHLRDFVVFIDQEVPGGTSTEPVLATVTTTQKDA